LTVDQGFRRSGENGFDPAQIAQPNEVLAQTQS
jgi:hypothetical protein